MNSVAFSGEEWWYVYIMRANNGLLYTGCTHDLSYWIIRHNSGYGDAASNSLPGILLGFTAFRDRQKAIAFERYLTSGSGRTFAQPDLF